ncbi:MAG: DUF4105 domain-containing protein [Gemmatimonadaceae bacterium]|nr:DUF4105 domain-containing protein [Gemmatimonadaceae bacterium]
MTLGQGDQIWERFGHNFLAIEQPGGDALAYNWGVFDFAAPDFLTRFLIGDTRYWMEANRLSDVIRVYQQYNRDITLQRLALTPAQADTLVRFLEWNARPENRYYRYDYFRDNCSTRLRDALDLALGGALRAATEPRITNLTYRSETLRLTDEAPASRFGIDIALGQPADRLLSAWESMFVPMRVQQYVRDIEVPGDDGVMGPLVTEERVVFTAKRAPERTRAASMAGELTVAGLLIAGLIVLFGNLALRRGSQAAGNTAAAIGAAWGGLTGIVGIVLVLAWVATQHAFWYRNENLFHFNPLAIALAVLLPLALRRPRWWTATRAVAFGVAGLSLAGAVLKLFPWMMQSNWGLIMLALPVNLAVAWVVSRFSNRAYQAPAVVTVPPSW